MFDIIKIKQIAKAVGVEVDPPDAKGQNGLFIRNKKGELEKWDAMSDFGLTKNKAQKSCPSFFNKQLFAPKNDIFTDSLYINEHKYCYSMVKENNKQTLISEAA